MPLDPQARAFLDQLAALGRPALQELTPEEARAAFENLRALAGPGEEVAKVEERRAGDVPVRVYWPTGEGPRPAIVYFHGGGWVIGDIESHDNTCRTLANGVGAVVVNTGYRLAPEHRFPAAADDCYSVTQWAHDHAQELGVDPGRIAVAGDSAGGNLATVVAMMARDRGGPPLAFQLLIYPVTDSDMGTVSYVDNADGYMLTSEGMRWFWDHYMGPDGDRRHPHASPFHAPNLSGLPPALVITAEFDPLRDEGEAYAERLRQAGVAVQVSRYDGMIHTFFGLPSLFDAAGKAIDEAVSALKEALSA